VVATFDACAAEVGLELPPMVGAVDSVDGLFSSLKRAVSKVVPKSIRKLANKAIATTTKVLKKTVAVASTVARSKYMSYGLSALAVVVPAVGVPALAAQMAAKRALDMYEDAKKAKALVQRGVRSAGAIAAVTRGGNVLQAVNKLARTNTPQARFAVAALKSLPARRAA
jgi:hypothetical protein